MRDSRRNLEGIMTESDVGRRAFILGASSFSLVSPRSGWAATADRIEPQPYFASVRRAMAMLATAGQPMAQADAAQLVELAARGDAEAVRAAEAILDRYTLARIMLDKAGRGIASLGGARRVLVEQGWRSFLVRVENPGEIRRFLTTFSPPTSRRSVGEQRASINDTVMKAPQLEGAWLHSEIAEGQPLSTASVEFRVLNILARERGRREAKLDFFTNQDFPLTGAQLWMGLRPRGLTLFSMDKAVFEILPAHDVGLTIKDSDGIGCMASLTITDGQGHIYPAQVQRIAPDMSFQPQIYRADGENIRLPDGDYEVSSWRGPEYVRQSQKVRIAGEGAKISVRLDRWIDPAKWGWYSGDTHIHNAGCSHYVSPTEGISPETMIRHMRGEGLAIGSALNWAPSWYYQKQFFSGQAISPDAALEHPELQQANNQSLKPRPTPKDKQSLVRYDVEVSGFPSSVMGHMVLLRLKQQDFPGTQTIEQWPSWNLPIYKWVREQGGLAGVAHCGFGMATISRELPNYEIPPMNGVGTQEAIVDVTHGYCDFLSGCQQTPAYEFNALYHMLNCGFRLAMVGETDWPCIYDDQVGMGRSYVQLDQHPVDETGYGAWIDGIKAGRLYVGDGRSHFLAFSLNGRKQGGGDVALKRPGEVNITAMVAARLEPVAEPKDVRGGRPIGWHIEHARIAGTRNVPLELVVNGQPVERIELLADGKPREVRFRTKIERSSWVALRILPSGHTHPIFVTVAEKPIRASKRSAQWCRDCVDKLWEEKHRFIRERERADAAAAYDHARRTYDRIIAESDVA